MILNGKIKLLYVAPNVCSVKDFCLFLDLVQEKKIGISAFATDEAHCVSEVWARLAKIAAR